MFRCARPSPIHISGQESILHCLYRRAIPRDAAARSAAACIHAGLQGRVSRGISLPTRARSDWSAANIPPAQPDLSRLGRRRKIKMETPGCRSAKSRRTVACGSLLEEWLEECNYSRMAVVRWFLLKPRDQVAMNDSFQFADHPEVWVARVEVPSVPPNPRSAGGFPPGM